jgi:hypothetical protein
MRTKMLNNYLKTVQNSILWSCAQRANCDIGSPNVPVKLSVNEEEKTTYLDSHDS